MSSKVLNLRCIFVFGSSRLCRVVENDRVENGEMETKQVDVVATTPLLAECNTHGNAAFFRLPGILDAVQHVIVVDALVLLLLLPIASGGRPIPRLS